MEEKGKYERIFRKIHLHPHTHLLHIYGHIFLGLLALQNILSLCCPRLKTTTPRLSSPQSKDAHEYTHIQSEEKHQQIS